jgi:hypothetical protein
VRLRTKVTKGPGSRAAGIAMAYKLIDAAQTRWRAVNAPHMVALVRAGAVFHKGKAARTTHRHHTRGARQVNQNGGRLNQAPSTQVLTISTTIRRILGRDQLGTTKLLLCVPLPASPRYG